MTNIIYVQLWILTVFIKAVNLQDQQDNEDVSEDMMKEVTFSVSPPMLSIEQIQNAGEFGIPQERGEMWYDVGSNEKEENDFSIATSGNSDATSSLSGGTLEESSERSVSAGSSEETDEKKKRWSFPRHCTPCPNEMMKKYKNINIKWICGGYQRARRSFKSTCMMRYRNCQDGTMFIKIYEGKCKNDSYHGRHFFYDYAT